MIEFVSALTLIFTTLFGYFSDFFNFKELFMVSYETLLIFIFFGRCFMTISYMQTIAEKKRIFFETIIFIIAIVCLGVLYLYHTGLFIALQGSVLQLEIFNICFLFFFTTKVYVLKNNIYGTKYLFWQIIDAILLTGCSAFYFNMKEDTLTTVSGFFAITIICLLGAVNKHIINKLDYWIALRDFKTEIKLMLLNNSILKITYPPDKNLEKDPIYSKCVIILNNSTIRVLDAHYLSRIILSYLLKDGYSFKEAHKISSKFLMVLNNNLMRRKLDSSLIPSRVLNFIYYSKRRQDRFIK